MRAILRLLPCKAGAMQRKSGIPLGRAPGHRAARIAWHSCIRHPRHRVAAARSRQQSGFLERLASRSDR